MMPIFTSYERDRTLIRIDSEINNDLVFKLCDEINLAIEYYRYRDIVIEVDSPGGSAASLVYFLTQLKTWRSKHQVRIGTLALTSAASAGAILVSMGDIGYRRAMEFSRLLYHEPRFFTTNETSLTSGQLYELHLQLHRTETRLLQLLVAHVYEHKVKAEPVVTSILTLKAGADEIGELHDPSTALFVEARAENGSHLLPEQIEASYRGLQRLNVFISPEIAQKMLLIDEIVTEK